MSSKEIAELTGKRHHDVLKDVRSVLFQLNITPLESIKENSFVANKGVTVERYSNGQILQYHLPKRECLILVSGYSVVLRASDRRSWQELEEQASQKAIALPDFTKPAIAARAWADQYEMQSIQAQQHNMTFSKTFALSFESQI